MHQRPKVDGETEKEPISSFIVENLSEFETIHQYIQGKNNMLPDSCSRYPMLGPKCCVDCPFA